MNTILILTVAGACMTIFYVACLKTVGGTFWSRKIWLSVAALFYLVPLGNLKVLYSRVLHTFGSDKYFQGAHYNELSDFMEIHMEHLTYKNETLRLDTLIYAVWMTVAVGIFLFNLLRHLFNRYWMASEYEQAGPKDLEVLERLKDSMKIRRRIQLVFSGSTSPMTMGFFRPVIVLPEKMRDNIPEPILKHELVHIKNGDMLIKVILNMIVTIHWFNPFAHLLMREYGKVFELICDEKATDGCSPMEKIDYVNRLLEESRPVLVMKSTWFHHLSKEGKFLKERIDNVMDKKENGKIRTCVGSIALVVALFISSLTAFAYEDVHGIEMQDSEQSTVWMDISSDATFNDSEVWFYVDMQKDSLITIAENAPVLYEEQFVDADGNVYEVHSDASPYLTCKHSFKDGILARHVTYTDGHCVMFYYEGQMCTICSYIILGDLINEITYKVCIH